jgi:hypothetical protein
MAKITNRLQLPQPIVDAVAADSYSRGDADISVTSLIDPPRLVALREKHWNDITEDASDRIWSLMGQSMHAVLERASRTGISERRLFIIVEGWKVSGGMDHYDATVIENETLTDYKLTTVYKFKNGGYDPKFEQQLNIYAEMLRQHGESVNFLKIVGILRDWSRAKARQEEGYPERDVVIRDIPLWAPKKAQEFIRERVILHQQARLSLPQCTEEERWAKPAVYAVKKKGGKRADALFDSKAAAEAHASMRGPDYSIEFRPGQSTRCEDYCPVSEFCEQFKKTQVFRLTTNERKEEIA